MDYSLLVGICPLKEDAVKSVAPTRLFQGKENYYVFGIIDFLQYYSARKRYAHAIKVARGKSSTGISTVEPNFYEERFVKFIRDHTKS
jgi:hypothetical protein